MPVNNTVTNRPTISTTTPVTPAVTTTTTPVETTPATTTTTTTDTSRFDGTTHVSAGTPVVAADLANGGVNPLLARFATVGAGLDPALMAKFMAATGSMDPAMLAALQTPQGLKAAVEKLSAAVIATDGAAITPEHEKQLFGMLAKLDAAGQLGPALTKLADQAQAAGALPADMPAEKKAALLQQFTFLLKGEMAARGVVPGTENMVFEDWQKMSQKHLAAVRATSVPPAGPGAPSAFTNPAFIKEFEQLTGAKFSSGNSVTPLINGPASFKERDRMIDGAKTSIHLMSWAFYDDTTGMETAKKLIEKHKQGVEVKIIVDGNVARQPGHDQALKLMEDAGINIVRWNDKTRPHDGQHRKVMIVDGKEAVAGGLNVGDVYSHRGPADGQKWRDTDVLVKGRAVADADALFASVWNQQVDAHGLAFKKVTPSKTDAAPGSGKTSVINDTPGPQGNAHILLATLKAIEGATKSVDIENAYFIQTPALRDALLKALERGVKVRILTNSAKSVDEPIVSAPILASLPELVSKGAEVYLKQGDTLHSKFMVVDGMYASVGSYNLHPRSERYEGEMTVNTIDEKVAKDLGGAFEKDLAVAQRINTPSEIEVPKTAFSILASKLFFDQL